MNMKSVTTLRRNASTRKRIEYLNIALLKVYQKKISGLTNLKYLTYQAAISKIIL